MSECGSSSCLCVAASALFYLDTCCCTVCRGFGNYFVITNVICGILFNCKVCCLCQTSLVGEVLATIWARPVLDCTRCITGCRGLCVMNLVLVSNCLDFRMTGDPFIAILAVCTSCVTYFGTCCINLLVLGCIYVIGSIFESIFNTALCTNRALLTVSSSAGVFTDGSRTYVTLVILWIYVNVRNSEGWFLFYKNLAAGVAVLTFGKTLGCTCCGNCLVDHLGMSCCSNKTAVFAFGLKPSREIFNLFCASLVREVALALGALPVSLCSCAFATGSFCICLCGSVRSCGKGLFHFLSALITGVVLNTGLGAGRLFCYCAFIPVMLAVAFYNLVNNLDLGNSCLTVGCCAGITNAECNSSAVYSDGVTGFYLASVGDKNTCISVGIGDFYGFYCVAVRCYYDCSGSCLVHSPVFTVYIIFTGVSISAAGCNCYIALDDSCILCCIDPIIIISIISNNNAYSGFNDKLITFGTNIIFVLCMSCCGDCFFLDVSAETGLNDLTVLCTSRLVSYGCVDMLICCLRSGTDLTGANMLVFFVCPIVPIVRNVFLALNYCAAALVSL